MLDAYPDLSLQIDWVEDQSVSFYWIGLYLIDPNVGSKGYSKWHLPGSANYVYDIGYDMVYRLKNSTTGQIIGSDYTDFGFESSQYSLAASENRFGHDAPQDIWFDYSVNLSLDPIFHWEQPPAISDQYLENWELEIGVYDGFGDWNEESSYSFYSTEGLDRFMHVTTSFAPSDIDLSAINFNADIDAGSTVAAISSDPGEYGTHYYYLDNSFGDNSLFDIVGNKLTIRGTPGIEFQVKDAYTIKIGLSDSYSRQYEEEFKLTVNDTNKPEYNVINSTIGKGKLRGTREADQFTFDQFESFGGKTTDKIIGLNSSQGDTIGVSPEAFPSLKGADKITFATAISKKRLKSLSRQDIDFLYFETKGRLFFNGNGSDKGWGDADEGGLFAILRGKPELSVDDFTLLA